MSEITDKKNRETIGNNLKDHREKKKLTQYDVASKANLNSNYYARIERGEVNFSVDILNRVLKALQINSSDILPF